jgi:hypothetical protein
VTAAPGLVGAVDVGRHAITIDQIGVERSWNLQRVPGVVSELCGARADLPAALGRVAERKCRRTWKAVHGRRVCRTECFQEPKCDGANDDLALDQVAGATDRLLQVRLRIDHFIPFVAERSAE